MWKSVLPSQAFSYATNFFFLVEFIGFLQHFILRGFYSFITKRIVSSDKLS